LEFAQPTKLINQPQGNTNKATIGTTLSILTNANEFNNNVPTVSVPQNNQGAWLKNVPEPVQGIIQETLVLPPLQNCPQTMDNRPIEKTNSNVPSRALVPKNWKMAEDVAATIIKPSPPKDKKYLKRRHSLQNQTFH
jgi:hypothetical protein